MALNTAGTPAATSLARAAGLDVRTARTYLDLLEDPEVIHRLPAWHSNRFTRLTKGPKLHLVDPALAAPAAGVSPEAAFRSGDLIGRLIETFVVAQLRRLVGEPTSGSVLCHLRERADGREIDLIVERRDGTLVAIEIKASSQPTQADARHLAWLRDRLGLRRGLGAAHRIGRHASRRPPTSGPDFSAVGRSRGPLRGICSVGP